MPNNTAKTRLTNVMGVNRYISSDMDYPNQQLSMSSVNIDYMCTFLWPFRYSARAPALFPHKTALLSAS